MPQLTVGTTDLMKEKELAAEWLLAPKTLANLRSRHEGPPYLRVLGSIRYSRRAVAEWLEQQQTAGRTTATHGDLTGGTA